MDNNRVMRKSTAEKLSLVVYYYYCIAPRLAGEAKLLKEGV